MQLLSASKALASNPNMLPKLFSSFKTAFPVVKICSQPWILCRTLSDFTSTPMPEISQMNPNRELKTHEDLHAFSLRYPDRFWGALARSRLKWIEPFQQVMDCDMAKGKISWFNGGKLNVSVNCVDRHYQKHPDRVALIWEKDEPCQEENITYSQLYKLMNQIGNLLRNHGVKKGDRVAIYMPASPIAVAAMLATVRIGAIHTIIFAGFSAEALSTRISDADVETVITCDQAIRGGKAIDLKKTVDAAVTKCPSVKRVFVSHRTGNGTPMGKKDIHLEKEIEKQPTECPYEPMNSDDPLFMLYTSGSTGKPKGIIHSQAGYLLYAAVTHKHVFDYSEGDIFGCVADIGWITGHSYVIYGPLCNGGTTLLFESTPVYPNPGRYWEMTERIKLTHFYGAPTAIRLLIKHGDQWVKKYDRSSLRILASVGEPLNHDAWNWYHQVVGDKKCDVIDTWWQTETGGICIAPRPSSPRATIAPGMPMRPMFGIDPVLIDQKGKVIDNNAEGALCIQQPWPGMAQTLHGDHKRFIETYFQVYPGVYCTGDGAHRNQDGHYQITGRIDDVINVTGHRLGTAEIEDVLDNHDDVAETAVVGYPHEIKGEGIYAYVVLKEKPQKMPEEIVLELLKQVKNGIAGYAVPEYIQICPGLPKTRSGKIMRRILRKIAANKSHELGDTSTLADPTVVDVIVEGYEKMAKRT